jgi:hypothetical protein
MLRAQAIGRRNWTLLGWDRGGRTASVLYTLTGICKHHGIDPFAYLRGILGRLPTQPADRLWSRCPMSGSRPIPRLCERRWRSRLPPVHLTALSGGPEPRGIRSATVREGETITDPAKVRLLQEE